MIRPGREQWKSVTLTRLEAMARGLVGACLAILIRKGEGIERVTLSGAPAPLPDFCQWMRSNDQGKHHCLTCRRMIALSVQFRGVTSYSCHGGVHIVAAPLCGVRLMDGQALAVASSAFAEADLAQGWKEVRSYARSSGKDLSVLREAYRALPVLNENNKKTMFSIMEVAAAAIGELGQQAVCASGHRSKHGEPGVIAERVREALTASRNGVLETGSQASKTLLADLVMDMIRREPAMAFTVSQVARAVRMTPNHFSTLFRKQTGKTFMAFLTEQRVERAKVLLSDPVWSVAEVAEKAGFSGTAYFSRRFKQMVGLPPTEWRETAHLPET